MIIDFHTHCFPPRLVGRAIEQLSYAGGGLEPFTDGTPEDLRRLMREDGVDLSVVMNIATNPHQQTSVNNFAAELCGDGLLAFGSVHPRAADVFDELERIASLGLRGVKFHPEYQEFYVDDPKMKPIYQKISQLGLITLFHAGHDIGYKPPYHCMPEHLERALSWFDSPVVAAHLGGWCCGEEVIRRLCGLPVYFDTAICYSTTPKPIAQEIIRRHGTDKILFGSDVPWHRPKFEMRLVESLELTVSDKERIYYKNAQKLLGLV